MTLEKLMADFDVRAMTRLNDCGLVKIGTFKLRADAERFVEMARTIGDCRIPSYNPVHPPLERNPDFQHLNKRADEKSEFDVTINIGEHNRIYTRLRSVPSR